MLLLVGSWSRSLVIRHYCPAFPRCVLPQRLISVPSTKCFMIKGVWKILKFNRSLYGKVSQFISFVVQSLSCVWLFVTPWTAARQASLSLTISQSLPKFMSITLVMPSSYLILWCPLLLLPSVFPSIREFSVELAVCSRWPKYWSFVFSISPSDEYSGLISLKIDWFDLLAVQGTFRNLLQHHSSNTSIL